MELLSRIGCAWHTMQKTRAIVISLAVSLLIGAVLYYTTNYSLIMVNMGVEYAIVLFAVQWLIGFFVGLNAALIDERYRKAREVVGVKKTAVASIVSIVVSGCPVCGVTVASSLGIAPLLAGLPFYGLELKVLSLGVLVYATYVLAGPPICRPKKSGF